MATHKAVQIGAAGGPLQLVDVDTAPPADGEVRISVSACGICGTDRAFVHGAFPGLDWPLTPGHEIAGRIAEIGNGVEDFAVGDRVAVGWFGGNCNHCDPCRKGMFIHCSKMKVPGWQYPGGYAESVTVPATALARIPAELSDAEAAPMVRRRGGSNGLHRRHDVQRVASHPGTAGRSGGGARCRRSGPSGATVLSCHGF